MKMKYVLSLAALALIATIAWPQSSTSSLVVHEWGTFTSFQGGDGTLLEWKPLVTAQLPSFVYDWQHPGSSRSALNPYSTFQTAPFTKGSLSALQRMETPVIYFYSDHQTNVDVTVRFPKGFITEWYPQASQVGPSMVNTNSPLRSTDWARNSVTEKSLIRWSHVSVIPCDTNSTLPELRTDKSGSHYFTARDTESALVAMDATETLQKLDDYEKFLFYRGVARFETPLHVVMKSDDAVNIANTGDEPLQNLFIVDIKGDTGRFVFVQNLAPHEVKTVLIDSSATSLQPLDDLSSTLAGQMALALTNTGLYPKEAAAMANTWKDSWFREQGVRVLYTLPRAWTDDTLPLTLAPAPRELVRTMVGRAEILPPGAEHQLISKLREINAGRKESVDEARELLKNLGRFAEPALNLAIADSQIQWNTNARLLALLAPPSQFE